jgi:putative ABC transport system permease protein
VNLALRDIRQDLTRFLLTAVGLGLLLTIVLGMTGIYNGMTADALVLPNVLRADLWVVQRGTRGPFAELSRVSPTLEARARSVPGVRSARAYASYTMQRERPGGGQLRLAVVGLAWPDDRGDAIPLAEGRALRQAHLEMIADRALGLALGERLRLGKDTYTVVGIADGMAGAGGDPLAFFTVADAQAIQYDAPGEAIRLEREARSDRLRGSDLGANPELVRRARTPGAEIPALSAPPIAAVLIELAPGASADRVRDTINAWPDVTVYTAADQRELLLGGLIERSRRQIGLYRVMLVVISTILMGLIIYTMTMEKLHSIALLRLLGARSSVIFGMILQESLALGAIAYLVALAAGALAFDKFPRRVLVEDTDRLALLAVVVAISFVASAAGVRQALAADPNRILAS